MVGEDSKFYVKAIEKVIVTADLIPFTLSFYGIFLCDHIDGFMHWQTFMFITLVSFTLFWFSFLGDGWLPFFEKYSSL